MPAGLATSTLQSRRSRPLRGSGGVKRLLDTNVVSDFVRGHDGVMQRLRGHAPADLVILTISRMEVAYGFARQPARAKRLARRLTPRSTRSRC